MNLTKIRPVYLVLAVLSLLACSNSPKDVTASNTASSSHSPESRQQKLAYEHQLSLQTSAERIAPLQQALQELCLADSDSQCVLLKSELSSGRYWSGQMQFRAKPAGIQKLIERASQGTELSSRSTKAEDLAAPMADLDKNLAMLVDYRARLVELQRASGQSIDGLIRLTQELATVQTKLDELNGQRQFLQKRIDTELLSLSLSAQSTREWWSPVAEASQDFADDLAEGIAKTITGLAYLLPWLLVLWLLVWLGRKLFRAKNNAVV